MDFKAALIVMPIWIPKVRGPRRNSRPAVWTEKGKSDLNAVIKINTGGGINQK